MASEPDAPIALVSLELGGLSAAYGGRPILQAINLRLQGGDSIALVGPNGCGKSTLCRVIGGLLLHSAGSLRLNGSDLAPCSADARARLGIGLLKQTANLFTSLTVRENLLLAGEVGAIRPHRRGRLETVEAMFPFLQDLSSQRAGLLSGGQRQSLAVAMVLMRQPAVLLLDEPIAGLSPAASRDLLAAVDDLRRREGFALLIVEHRLRQVRPFVNRLLVMREGCLVADTRDTRRLLDANWLASHYQTDAPR